MITIACAGCQHQVTRSTSVDGWLHLPRGWLSWWGGAWKVRAWVPPDACIACGRACAESVSRRLAADAERLTMERARAALSAGAGEAVVAEVVPK